MVCGSKMNFRFYVFEEKKKYFFELRRIVKSPGRHYFLIIISLEYIDWK